MIIDNFDVVSVTIAPYETDPPLVVNPNAVLTSAAATELFQVLAQRNPQVLQRLLVVQHRELATRGVLDALKTEAALTIKERLRVFASERPYHRAILLRVT
jgi:hypothetical protein